MNPRKVPAVTRVQYDALRRPTHQLVTPAGGAEIVVTRTVYGEQVAEPQRTDANLRGRVFRVYDGAGVSTNVAYDFEGNLTAQQRRLAIAYETRQDWSALDAAVSPTADAIAALAEPLCAKKSEASEPNRFRVEGEHRARDERDPKPNRFRRSRRSTSPRPIAACAGLEGARRPAIGGADRGPRSASEGTAPSVQQRVQAAGAGRSRSLRAWRDRGVASP
jgi:hypothetical protein